MRPCRTNQLGRCGRGEVSWRPIKRSSEGQGAKIYQPTMQPGQQKNGAASLGRRFCLKQADLQCSTAGWRHPWRAIGRRARWARRRRQIGRGHSTRWSASLRQHGDFDGRLRGLRIGCAAAKGRHQQRGNSQRLEVFHDANPFYTGIEEEANTDAALRSSPAPGVVQADHAHTGPLLYCCS